MNLKRKIQIFKPHMPFMLAKDWAKMAIFHEILMKILFLWSKIKSKLPNFEWNSFKGIKTTLKS